MSFSVSQTEPIAWHYASVKIDIDEFDPVVEIATQSEKSFLVLTNPVGDLRAIYYGSDTGKLLECISV